MNTSQTRQKASGISTLSRVLMLASSLLLVAMLASCSATSAGEELLERLDRIEAELDTLLGSEGTSDSSSTNDTSDSSSSSSNSSSSGTGTNSSGSSSSSSSSSSTTAASYDELSATLSDLTTRIDEAIATSEEVSVPTDLSSRLQAYREAKAPLSALEDELDLLEDAVKYSGRTGTITYEQMWELDRSIDSLDDLLDLAEDALEWRMGVDD